MEYSHSNWIIILTLFCGLSINVDLCSGQNATVSDSGSRGAIEEAMVPFYSMTNNFLELVQPKSSNSTLLNLVAEGLSEGNSEINIDNWQQYGSEYIGLAVCVAIGLVFVVVMPIVGLILCCCRFCCGHCGAHAESKPDKNERCSLLVCSVLLFVFTMFILAGTVLAFITNEYLWQQTAFNGKGLMHDTEETLVYLDSYKIDSKNDFQRLATDIKRKIDSVIVDVKRLPKEVGESFIKDIDPNNVLTAAKELQTSVTSIKTDLTNADSHLNELQNLGNTLVTQLNNLVPRMSNTLQGCPASVSSQCDILRGKVASLQQIADFSRVGDVTNFLNDLRNVQLDNVYDKAVEEYRKIEGRLNGTIASRSQKIEDIGNSIKADVDSTVAEVDGTIDDELDLGSVKQEVNSVKPEVQEYGNYRKYGGIAIGCSLLITGVLFFLGLLFGCFGSDPDSESACNKATGANLLMGGIVWTFVFSWILMIIVIALFVTGGLSYTDGCRYMVHIGQTPESIRALEAMNRIAKKAGLEDVNITSMVLKCKANKGAYEAFDLARFVDIDKELDVEKYDLQGELDKVKTLPIRIPAIDIINDENYQQLTDLGNANLQNIDFQSFYNEFQYDLTNENLATLATEAVSLASQIQAAGDANKASSLQSEAAELQSIHDSTVSQMISRKNQLELAVRSLERSVKGSSGSRVFSDYVANLKDAFDELQYQLNLRRANSGALSTYLQTEAQAIYDDITNYIEKDVKMRIRNEIASCGGLYNKINYLLTTSLCERVVNPFNAFWFSVGWCLFFFIPSIIVAWDLNIQYRRIGYYGPDKGFEDGFRY